MSDDESNAATETLTALLTASLAQDSFSSFAKGWKVGLLTSTPMKPTKLRRSMGLSFEGHVMLRSTRNSATLT